jgi:hypothetical protein
MKRILFLILVIILILMVPALVFGATPVGFGAKAAAMGGAFTAVADDGSAAYWNPAGINQLGFFTLTPGVGIYGSYDPNFNYSSLNNSTTFPPPIPNGNVGIPIFAGITTRYAGANIFGDLSTTTVDNSACIKMYADGSIYGTITGAASFDHLMVGASYKIVKGQSANYYMAKFDPDNPAEALAILSDGDNNTSTVATGDGYACDIGVLYQLTDKVKLGFAARNLLSSVAWSGTKYKYTIDEPNSDISNSQIAWNSTQESYSATTFLPRTYTVGASCRLSKSTLIAADIEIITAEDADLNQTRFHIGFEQTALWNAVALRLGAFTDKNEASVGLTAGLGFKLGPVLVDVAALKAGDSSLGFFATAGFKF